MAKKTIISSLLLTNTPPFAAAFFKVGAMPLNSAGKTCTIPGEENAAAAFPVVTKIEHCRDRFGGGAQIDQPCYVIYFQDAEERFVIPITSVCQATVILVDTAENVIPTMPM